MRRARLLLKHLHVCSKWLDLEMSSFPVPLHHVLQVAERLGVHVGEVKNVIIWGNHSSTQFPDVAHGTAAGKPILEAIWRRGLAAWRVHCDRAAAWRRHHQGAQLPDWVTR